MMIQFVSIAAGGAIGALLRYGGALGAHYLFGRGFPYGTLLVNVIGSFAIGVVYILIVERSYLSANWQPFLMIGLLGSLTTFSTFSLETIQLLAQGQLFKAGLNILLSVVLCLIGCWLGIMTIK